MFVNFEHLINIDLFYIFVTEHFSEIIIVQSYLLPGFLIAYFMSLYLLNTLFIRTNSSRIISESIKTLKTKTSKLFNLGFANNTTLSCFFPFFYLLTYTSLIPAVIAQTDLAISIRIPINEEKAETETHTFITETKTSDRSM